MANLPTRPPRLVTAEAFPSPGSLPDAVNIPTSARGRQSILFSYEVLSRKGEWDDCRMIVREGDSSVTFKNEITCNVDTTTIQFDSYHERTQSDDFNERFAFFTTLAVGGWFLLFEPFLFIASKIAVVRILIVE